jgi:hypothetical protein
LDRPIKGRAVASPELAVPFPLSTAIGELAYRYGITGSTVYALDALVAETTRLIDRLAQREGRK